MSPKAVMEFPTDEFADYWAEMEFGEVYTSLVMADAILGGGKHLVSPTLERYAPKTAKERERKAETTARIAARTAAVRKRAKHAAEKATRKRMKRVLAAGLEARFVKDLRDNPALSKERVAELVEELMRLKARLQAEGKLPPSGTDPAVEGGSEGERK